MSLPPELDFFLDPEASKDRMNRAMEYIYFRLAAATALQPEFETAIKLIQSIGLERLDEVLGPILIDATDIAARLSTIRDTWLGSEPLMAATAALTAQVSARLAANSTDVAAQLAANATGVAAQLAAVDTKLGQLSPTAKWAEANVAEARVASASRLMSAAILWAMQVPVGLVDAATIAVDLSAGVNFSLVLAGNRTLGLPTAMKLGQSGRIRVQQDPTGGRTLAFAAGYRTDGAAMPLLNAAAGAITVLRYEVTGAGEVTLWGGRAAAVAREQTYELCIDGRGANGVWFASVEQRVKLNGRGNAFLYAMSTTDYPAVFGGYQLLSPNVDNLVTIPANAALRLAPVSTDSNCYVHVSTL